VDVGPVARQQVANVRAEPAQSDQFLQAQRPCLLLEFLFQQTFAEDIQGVCESCLLGLGQDLKQVSVVLDRLEIANGDEVTHGLGPRRPLERGHKVVNDRGRHGGCLREPTG